MNIFLKISNNTGNQAKTAELIGVSTSAYSAWVVGKKFPSAKNAKKIKNIFGVSFDDIYQNNSAPTSTDNKNGQRPKRRN